MELHKLIRKTSGTDANLFTILYFQVQYLICTSILSYTYVLFNKTSPSFSLPPFFLNSMIGIIVKAFKFFVTVKKIQLHKLDKIIYNLFDKLKYNLGLVIYFTYN